MLKNYLFSPLCSGPLFLFSFLCSALPSFFSVQPFLFLFFSLRVSLFSVSCSAFYFSAQNRVEPKAQNVLLLLVQPPSSLSALAFLFSPHHCFSLFLFCFSLCSFCFMCCPLKAHKRVQLFLCVPPSQFLANF